MADDIAALIEHLHLEKVDLLGYSLGGAVALQTAFRHPQRVSKLVVISSPFKWTGWYPEVRAGMASIAAEPLLGTPLHDAYQRLAPRPEDFPRLAASMRQAMSQDYDWTDAVSRLRSPTLIVAGDADSFSPSHAAAFFGLLGGGKEDAGWQGERLIPSQLAILPGTTHYTIIFRAVVGLREMSGMLPRCLFSSHPLSMMNLCVHDRCSTRSYASFPHCLSV
jgi:pimeloyl-ACP methyl ester carboxylesterase